MDLSPHSSTTCLSDVHLTCVRVYELAVGWD